MGKCQAKGQLNPRTGATVKCRFGAGEHVGSFWEAQEMRLRKAFREECEAS